MAKNELSIFNPDQVPDHIRKYQETVETNITNVPRADTLTYKGKVWSVSVGGNKQVLMKKNEDGDEEPRAIIPVVVLGYAKRRGRSYYDGGFAEGSTSAPKCWSPDGIKPSDQSEEKQSDKCATCPMAAKGSKVTEDQRETKACQEHKFVAVQLYRKWDMPPLRLRLAITSLYDAKNKAQEEKGYFAFDQYCEMLRARGVKHTAEVVTRLKFDPNVAYPKVLFNASAWVGEEELEAVSEIAHSDAIQALVNPDFANDSETTEAKGKTKPLPKEDPEEDEPELKPAKPKATKPAAAAPAKPAAAAPTKPAATTTKPKPKPAPEPEEDEEAAKGEIVDEGGEDATDVTDAVGDIVEAAEDDDEEAAIREAEAKAKALRDKAAAAARARKAAPKGTPAGKPAAVSQATQEVIDDWE